jgi:TetR/AcrR family fatty acid metabolism transcriptional regulator
MRRLIDMEKRGTSRGRQAERMRQQIQQAALELFNRYGFDHVSMADIAKAAGCSTGNIYHYFPNKEALTTQMTTFVDERYAEYEKEYLTDTSRSWREKLLNFIGCSLLDSVSDQVLYSCFIYGLKKPEHGALKISERRVWIRLLHELVRGCQEEGSIARTYDEDEIVHDLVILHRGILFEWRIDEEKFDLQEKGRSLGEIFLRGLEADK